MNHAKLLDILTSLPVSLMPYALEHHIQQTMWHAVISAAVDRHMNQSEDVYL